MVPVRVGAMAPSPTPIYREVLSAPWSWWLIGVGFALSMFLIGLRYLSPGMALLMGGLSFVPIALGLLAYGGIVIRVTEDGLQIGRGVLEWPWVEEVTVHDADATRDRMGPGADVRAWLCVRPYLSRTVEIGIDDPADPHPYWLIGTRRPELLAAAINAQLRTRSTAPRRRVGSTDPTGVAAEE